MPTWTEFLTQRNQGPPVQFFPAPGATRTIMVCSHIWWTEQIALAVLQSGHNLLIHPPFYTLYTDESAYPNFHQLWNIILDNIKATNVDLILGGNSSAMLLHPDTREFLPDALARHTGKKIPIVNWWWDEPRTRPPLARANVTPAEFVQLLNHPSTLNAIWDLDVKEELAAQLGLTNLFHLPLATLPEFWPHGFLPLEQRPLAACFLGNCHFTADWIDTNADPLFPWAREIVRRKILAPQTPMQSLIDAVTHPAAQINPTDNALSWESFSRPMEVLNAAYMHTTRNRFVQAARNHLGGKLALIGKGWDQLGIKANMEHAGEKSGVIYAQSQASLNLFGGCVHGGLPLRPYDIGASGGLLLTHDQRELPTLFDPGTECLPFRSPEEMNDLLTQIHRNPAHFNPIPQATRKRVLAHHTWQHRITQLLRHLDSL